MSRTSRWLAAALLGLAMTAQADAQDPAPQPPQDPTPVEETTAPSSEDAQPATDLIAQLGADGRFTVLLGALERTNLVATLQGEGPFTLFAPTDDAFAALPEGALAVLTPEQLQDVLLYHVVGAEVGSEMARSADDAPTANGQTLQLTATDDRLRVNDALVIESDLDASNGVIHVIDSVLMPPPRNASSGDGSSPSPGDGSDAESELDDGP